MSKTSRLRRARGSTSDYRRTSLRRGHRLPFQDPILEGERTRIPTTLLLGHGAIEKRLTLPRRPRQQQLQLRLLPRPPAEVITTKVRTFQPHKITTLFIS